MTLPDQEPVFVCSREPPTGQDADKPVGKAAKCVIVIESLGALLIVEGAGAGRVVQGCEGLGAERVDEPVVVDEAGGDHLLLAA
jgi:hypothetical protein